MEIQTRSCEGELKYFSSFKEALEFANNSISEVNAAFSDGAPIAELDPVEKISFSLPNGERVRLVFRDGDWVLRQMEDEIAEVLHP